VKAVKEVDEVVCPCPLIVSPEFMESHQIDLVVHGFANEEDAQRQHVFFEDSMRMGKFQRIEYYRGLSTTDIIQKIKMLPEYTENEDV
jgi:choline-phosphate cytidylyltransferase